MTYNNKSLKIWLFPCSHAIELKNYETRGSILNYEFVKAY
jgi:hypothetical protein